MGRGEIDRKRTGRFPVTLNRKNIGVPLREMALNLGRERRMKKWGGGNKEPKMSPWGRDGGGAGITTPKEPGKYHILSLTTKRNRRREDRIKKKASFLVAVNVSEGQLGEKQNDQ